MQVEKIHSFESKILRDILFIEHNCFPKEWIYDDAGEYYKKMLENKNNINILLKDQGKSLGYLLAIPHNEAVSELKNDDPGLKEDSMRYYIDTVGILSEFREKGYFSIMFECLASECKKRGINKISMHARVNNKFSSKMQKKLRITEIRRIEHWRYYNFEEPTDYIDAIL